LRHNLDVMHGEKYLWKCYWDIIGYSGENKRYVEVLIGFVSYGSLKIHFILLRMNKYLIPLAQYTMSKEEKAKFCQKLKDVKFHDAYASNISHCIDVSKLNILGLKSDDYHVLFERIVPLSIKGLLPKDACDPLVELSLFFGNLRSTIIFWCHDSPTNSLGKWGETWRLGSILILMDISSLLTLKVTTLISIFENRC